jgi:predicted PurR-regulated permease PerM
VTTNLNPTFARVPWDSLLIWGLLFLAIYALHDVFLIAFLTFLLSYLVRSIVGASARRLHPGTASVRLERWLTLGAFAAIVLFLWALLSLIGPQFVLQSRLLMTDAQRLNPEQVFNQVLSRSVGAYLLRQTYGPPADPRYQAALRQFESDGRLGEGAFTSFGRLQSAVQSQFEIDFERAEQQRLRDQLLRGGADSRRFADWFITVKAPALVAAQRSAYLARLAATGEPATGTPASGDVAALDRRLAELAFADLRARPADLNAMVKEWESVVAVEQWRQIQNSPAYLQAFRAWFDRTHGDGSIVPYDFDTYLALRDAYREGLDPFNEVYRERVAPTADQASLLQGDFQRATEADLARRWWASSPAAASLREHLSKEPERIAAVLAGRVEGFMSSLIAIPAQVATALLLTILITFDMSRLREGAAHLRESRVAPIYDKIVPNLVAVARLIGRSFAAQGLIAVFNTLLTFVLLQILGLQNELLLCAIVFIGSFIPVLGVILSGIPITLQALMQPDGSLALALYALLGIAIIHAIEATVLSPRIVGRILHLHPVLVMVVLIIGEHLFGIWGLLLGVPVAVYLIHAGILGEAIPGVYEPAGQPQPG